MGRVPFAIIDNRDKPPGWRNTAFWCGKKADSRGQLAACITKNQMQGYQGRGQRTRKGGKDGKRIGGKGNLGVGNVKFLTNNQI